MPSITFILLTISVILTTGFCDDKQSISVRNSPFHDESDENLESAKIDACMSNELELRERENCRFFAIMIDAGSTGTRISINEFQHETNFTCAGAFKLENETHVEVKPGLSSFADQPEKAAEKINQLLSVAVETVPANLQKHTPIALRATAGLRLLPGEKADEILRQARLALSKSPFLISDDIDDSVSILSGTDEGIFGWFTLNFLLDRLKAVLHDPNELVLAVRERWTAGALDLGGGSTQLAKKMRGIEVSWALGGAYHLLNNYHQKQMKNVENNKVSPGKIGNDLKSNTSWAIYLMEKAYVKVRWVAETFRLL